MVARLSPKRKSDSKQKTALPKMLGNNQPAGGGQKTQVEREKQKKERTKKLMASLVAIVFL